MNTLFLQNLPNLTYALSLMVLRAVAKSGASLQRSQVWIAAHFAKVLQLKHSAASDVLQAAASISAFLHRRSEVRRRFIRRKRYLGGDVSQT